MISFILDRYYLYLRSLLSSLRLVFICFFYFCFMTHLCFFIGNGDVYVFRIYVKTWVCFFLERVYFFSERVYLHL